MQEAVQRQAIERALQAGRKRQSPHTRWIHSMEYHRVPLFDNALFILALFRTKNSDNIQEALFGLDRLLCFQNSDGSFPEYLHEFQQKKQRLLYCVFPLFWVYKEFGHIIKDGLRERLKQALIRACMHDVVIELLYAKVQTASLLIAVGSLLKDIEIEERGRKLLPSLDFYRDFASFAHPEQLAILISSYELTHDTVDSSYWEPLIHWFESAWSTNWQCFVGPTLYREQERCEHVITPVDLYLALFSDTLPKESAADLFLSLIWKKYALRSRSLPVYREGKSDSFSWSFLHTKDWAASAIITNYRSVGFYPFRCILGAHSLYASFGNGILHTAFLKEEHITLCVRYDCEIVTDKKEESEICSFLWAYTEGQRMGATVFTAGQEVALQIHTHTVHMKMQVIEGEACVAGHFRFGNRHGQIMDCQSAAFDRECVVRFIRGVCPFILQIELGLPQVQCVV